jgi:signal transduction histidine kinase
MAGITVESIFFNQIRNESMRKLPGIGLRGEITLNLVLFVSMMIIMMAFLLFDVSRESVVVQRIEDRRGMVESILENVESTLSSNTDLSVIAQSESLREFLQGCLDGGIIQEARLISIDGEDLLKVGDVSLLGESGLPDIKEAIDNERLLTRINRDNRILFKDLWGEAIISTPVRYGDEVVGGLQIVSQITEVKDGILHYNWHVLILLTLFSILMVIVISYSLSHEVVNPIEEILDVMEKVKKGDLKQYLSIKSGNEIGRLAESFNTMLRELRKNRKEVDKYVESLTEVNSKLMRAEHRALRTESLVTIGKLATGVANEMGNPLGALYGHLEQMKKKVSGDEEKGLLDKIEKEINRINEIIFGLLDLSRDRKKGQKKAININEIIEKTISLLSSQNGLEGIGSQLHLKLDLPGVEGNPREFQQALINVVVNAVEAMPTGGILTVKTAKVSYQNGEICEEMEPVRREGDPLNLDFSPLRKRSNQEFPPVSFGDGQEVVVIEISDTGKGIKKEHISQIFDPFFTAREDSKGTGLGLSIAEKVIRGMGGLIRVTSKWGKGSTFYFYLPIMNVDVESSKERDEKKESLDRRSNP